MSRHLLPEKVAELAAMCDREWSTMAEAAVRAVAERDRLKSLLREVALTPADASVVIFGSLARDEWTPGTEASPGSDLDWTLLVDGHADGGHPDIARGIGETIVDAGRHPGPTEVFGRVTFSHDIVHFIGGQEDTNRNTTRRILLLLESRSLDKDEIRARVLRTLLQRYVGEDSRFHDPESFRVPRFLLNDYARYWRTMSVDSAQKRKERPDWVLRAIKLRMSRKLIFTSGLWACLSCHLHPPDALEEARRAKDGTAVVDEMVRFLLEFTTRTPLETLAEAFGKYAARTAAELSFDAYEQFLGILDEPGNRTHLKRLRPEDALRDPLYQEARKAADQFQLGLERLFFNTDAALTAAVQTYGVF